ncbi:trihelix transcription factor ENAP1-like [Rhododendron vialii]|uniref:trihelix transcription factor ENAP1-like n=1 Tax=Rhododendron vialii TaxID=182163 RepID=UPI00265E2969|nr:trihelix transcription factor ENAP1-like [Rhododendron vialii]
MSSPPLPEKPPRKFLALCWTQSETLALIDAYRDRSYALRHGYLCMADWDAVPTAVTGRFLNVSPAKTSAQCRHKMEKLRQCYRTEKQCSFSFPGHFFSSWLFFENMDSVAGDRSNPNPNLNLGNKKIDTAKSNPNNQEDLRGRNPSPNYCSRVLNNGYEPYLEDGSDDDVGDDADLGEGYGVRTPIDVKLAPPVFRAKKID